MFDERTNIRLIFLPSHGRQNGATLRWAPSCDTTDWTYQAQIIIGDNFTNSGGFYYLHYFVAFVRLLIIGVEIFRISFFNGRAQSGRLVRTQTCVEILIVEIRF
uniref:Uncharacterized protein n=1 Tax=Romanomermis culicivorax TaxID=13658 RepID=A0A915ITT8_ROMCU